VVLDPTYTTRRERYEGLPRKVLANFARAQANRPVFTLDALASSVALIPSEPSAQRFMNVVENCSEQWLGSQWGNLFALRVYGLLNSGQRRQVSSRFGLSLDLNQASSALQKLIWDHIRSEKIELGWNGEFTNSDGEIVKPFEMSESAWEQTTALADRRFWPARIWMKLLTLDVVLMECKSHSGVEFSWERFEDVAYTVRDQLDELATGVRKPDPNRYSVNSQLTLGFGCQFGPADGMRGQFVMLGRAPGSFLPFESMPSAFRKKIMERIEQIRRREIEDGDGK
jgi:hypothetical protein